MGKARNHGGTGGHGYFPLPGERPNYNLHVMADRKLLNLVTNKDRNKVVGQSGKPSERKPMATGNQLKEQMLFVKQSVTDKKNSANKLVTPVNQPVVPLRQMDTPVKDHVTSSFHQVNPVKHLLTPAKEQTTHLNLKVTSVKQKMSIFKQQETTQKQLITPEDPVKQLVTALMQPVTKCEDTKDCMKEKVHFVRQPMTSTKENYIKQLVPSVKQLSTPDNKLLTFADQLVAPIKHLSTPDVTPDNQHLTTLNLMKPARQLVSPLKEKENVVKQQPY